MRNKLFAVILTAMLIIASPVQAFAAMDFIVDQSSQEDEVSKIDMTSDESVEFDADDFEGITDAIDVPQEADELMIDMETEMDAEDQPEVSAASADELPVSYDLRDKGLVTDTKNQGDTGTCWAFAGLSAVETSIMALTGEETDLSETYAAWFVNSLYGGEGMSVVTASGAQADPFYEVGDNGEYLASRLASWDGPMDEASVGIDYPAYGEIPEEELSALSEGDEALMNGTHVQDIEFLPSPVKRNAGFSYGGYNEVGRTAIKQALTEDNAVTILIRAPGLDADNSFVNFENNALYVSAGNMMLNHMVTIVGYDDSYNAGNFTTEPEGDGAWICKNSWGTIADFIDYYVDEVQNDRERILDTFSKYHPDIPEDELADLTDEDLAAWLYDMTMPIDRDGYFYVSYYDKSLYQPVVYHSELNEYDINHQYDNLGMMSTTTLALSESSGTSANVFTCDTDEELKAVSAYNSVAGCSAEISVYKLDQAASMSEKFDPRDGELVAEQSATLDYKGYHTIELDEPVALEAGDAFAVVETIKSQSGSGYTPIELGKSEKSGGATYNYVVADHARGESYVLSGDKWIDTCDYKISGYKVGNVMIKAFAVSEDPDAADDGGDGDDSGDYGDDDGGDSGDYGDGDDSGDYGDDDDSGDSFGGIEDDLEELEEVLEYDEESDALYGADPSDETTDKAVARSAEAEVSSAPDTGDSNELIMWLTIFGASLVLLVILAGVRRRLE